MTTFDPNYTKCPRCHNSTSATIDQKNCQINCSNCKFSRRFISRAEVRRFIFKLESEK